jgi:hypothetical protein
MRNFTVRQIFASIAGALAALAMPASGETVLQNINGLQITIDSNTGCLLGMACFGPGAMLKSVVDRASIIDLAYPVKSFEPLRLAPRFSTGAKITRSADTVTIHWDTLGPSRTNFPIPGNVCASVRLSAHPDGKSIIITAQVENNSDNDVRQVIFPDFAGLQPFNGELGTWLRTGGFSELPFQKLGWTETRESASYFTDEGAYAEEHKSGGMFDDMFLRWIDFGGLKGGMSLFPKRWGFDPPVTIRLQRSEADTSIRLLSRNDVTLKKGEKWESGEWVLTPHQHGWAEGIEPFREWVQQHYQRDFSMPKHVREGLGYRTAWMCQSQPDDPQDAVFKFSDLPGLARECAEHGLDEMILWSWNKIFVLPLPGPFRHLGTAREMEEAVRRCRRMGVNVVPFVSVLQANPETAPRYGLRVGDNNGWTYHTELLPRWNPPYATDSSCVQAGPCNKQWHDDVLAGAEHLADTGIPSLCWDQFWTTHDPEPNMISLAREIRRHAREADPECTFSGEELWNVEIDSAILDYTWNWAGYKDCRAFTSVFPSPRANCCVSSSALTVKKAFADKLYLNVLPRKAESVNGSDWINHQPEMSKALKQCARLKRQFMDYFTNGKLIGDCILSAECADAHVCAYTLTNKAIIVFINLEPKKRKISFDANLEPWTKSSSGRYEMRCYNAEAKAVAVARVAAKWHGRTHALEPEEMAVIEFVSK